MDKKGVVCFKFTTGLNLVAMLGHYGVCVCIYIYIYMRHDTNCQIFAQLSNAFVGFRITLMKNSVNG
jgi:hypothetical protein